MTDGSSVRSLVTERLTLRQWRDDDRIPFAAMNADPEVMDDLGGVLDLDESNRKLDRFAAYFDAYRYGRWVVEGSVARAEPAFLGYAGVMPCRDADHPLGHHDDIGWRLCRDAWGHGIATEAAMAALRDVFDRVGLTEVVAHTASENLRSRG